MSTEEDIIGKGLKILARIIAKDYMSKRSSDKVSVSSATSTEINDRIHKEAS